MRAKEPDIDEITKWLKVKKVKEMSDYFLVLEYQEFYEQVFMIILANLKIKHSEVIYNLLVEGFEKAI